MLWLVHVFSAHMDYNQHGFICHTGPWGGWAKEQLTRTLLRIGASFPADWLSVFLPTLGGYWSFLLHAVVTFKHNVDEVNCCGTVLPARFSLNCTALILKWYQIIVREWAKTCTAMPAVFTKALSSLAWQFQKAVGQALQPREDV